MAAIVHVLKVFGVVLYRTLMLLLKVLLALAAFLLLVKLCVMYESFATVLGYTVGSVCVLAVGLMAALFVWDVSDSIKRKSK